MHHSFTAIETQLIAAAKTTGGSFIFPTASMNNVAQGAAVLAVLLMTKNEKLKSLCSASGISALLGITEPAMFGVNLKLKYPFYAAIIGSAVGSAWIAGTHTLALAMGAAGLPGFISIAPQSWGNFAIGIVLSMAVSFALTVFFMKRHPEGKTEEAGSTRGGLFQKAKKKNDKKEDVQSQAAMTDWHEGEILAPFTGKVAPIDQCADPVFASRAMGDGLVITPENGTLVSPVDGTVMMVFPTKHAIGLQSRDGTEILIHIGMDTVSLDGRPYTVLVESGQCVKAGQKLIKADLDAIREAGLSVETPIVITNGKSFSIEASGQVAAGTPIAQVEKENE